MFVVCVLVCLLVCFFVCWSVCAPESGTEVQRYCGLGMRWPCWAAAVSLRKVRERGPSCWAAVCARFQQGIQRLQESCPRTKVSDSDLDCMTACDCGQSGSAQVGEGKYREIGDLDRNMANTASSPTLQLLLLAWPSWVAGHALRTPPQAPSKRVSC